MTVQARHGLQLLVLSLLATSQAVRASTEHYAIDPVHTRLAFQVSHAGFSNPIATFSGITGMLSFDEADWSSAKVDVAIPVKTLQLGDDDWNRKILDRTFLDADTFPDARFVSTRVVMQESGKLRIEGQLTLHGRTAPVRLEATVNAIKRHPLTLRRTAGFSATRTLSRKAFGIDAWPSLVGDDVRLIIEVEATRQRQPDATGDQEDADPQHD